MKTVKPANHLTWYERNIKFFLHPSVLKETRLYARQKLQILERSEEQERVPDKINPELGKETWRAVAVNRFLFFM